MKCPTCSELQRENEALRAGNAVLRAQNMNLAVQNNNLRHALGCRMQPVTPGYLVEWERKQEGSAA